VSLRISRNSTSVSVDAASTLDVSAQASGDAGSISVIAGTTHFYGSAFAQGGALSGNGGTIETSGHALDVGTGQVNVGAGGEWLLRFVPDVTQPSAAQTDELRRRLALLLFQASLVKK